MSDVNMPKLSDTMEEGTVLEWKKRDGEEVHKGDVLAEIESDKASFDIEAEADGVLHVVVGSGQSVPVGQLIGRIGGEAPAPTVPTQPAAPDAPRTPQPPATTQPQPQPEAVEVPAPAPAPSAAEPVERTASEDGSGRVKASPLARRLAVEMGVDLLTVEGSGPEGRIVKEDVMAAAERGRRLAPGPAATVPRPRTAGPAVEVEEPNRMQATIARRMVESKTTVPHFYVTVEARVGDAVRTRQQLKDLIPNADQVTMTDLLTRACAIALTRFPEVNASWVDGHFERKRSVNIGLAVAPAQGMGLLVPVVHDVERKDLVQISIESRQVIERARSGKPSPGDLDGGTFSISNLGMYGVDEFAAIVNPPEAAILAVGAIKDVPVVEDGRVGVGKVMRMTLSVDHRVFYGSTAAQFMAEVKRLIENPVTLLAPP
ncbi:MAG TPA: dihydrolipoamide acetyltransferase family protein [Candidatus Dormibacteraeota bacterium]|nr:dihydrolipoamide acetyltransferase family protein [Candidatus Dormibacteraeota bacterium]